MYYTVLLGFSVVKYTCLENMCSDKYTDSFVSVYLEK